MSAAYWLQGDTRAVLAEMAAAGIVVDLVVTSPPFLNLRSYLPAGDPAKALEIGSEPTPCEFIDTLLDVTDALDRVLAPHGSLCVELGDTYAGSGGAGGDYAEGGLRDGQNRFNGSAARARAHPLRDRTRTPPAGWPAEKSMCGIPELYRLSLMYGRNLLTGRPTPRWRVRNTVTWVRPNPPVGRDGDKFRPATSDVVVACRTDDAGRQRYWDGDAVRSPALDADRRFTNGPKAVLADEDVRGTNFTTRIPSNPAGAPLLDWWKIAASGYDGAHYATFPPALVTPLVKAMCPERVCMVCGEPSRRMLGEATYVGRGAGERSAWESGGTHHGKSNVGRYEPGHITKQVKTLGWTDCGHDAWRPGIVLDPFAGSGTTLAVATGHGRDAIGIDLDSRNVDLARDRVGPLFFHETTVPELAGVLAAQRPSDRGAA